MKPEIDNLKLIERANTLLASFDLVLDPFVITNCMLFQKGEKTWVNFPAKEYQDKETGETKYQSIIKIPEESRYWRFQAWATAEAMKLYEQAKAEVQGQAHEEQSESIGGQHPILME